MYAITAVSVCSLVKYCVWVCAHVLSSDVRYTHDEVVTPLMSAVTVWNAMDEVVADANLHQTVKRLLFVQVGTLQNTIE